MGKVDLSKTRASSLFPGLQNVGTTDTTITVYGQIQNQANLVGTGRIFFPKECMAVVRLNLPDANGDLATKWFPVMGTIQLYDATAKWYLTLYTLPDPQGRTINFDFTSNDAVNTTTLNGFRIHLFAHIYTYPWSTSTS